MMPKTPEQRARKVIDTMLIATGWAVQDYKSYNPGAARWFVLRESPLKSGRCDYLLLIDRKAVGIIEAKKEGTTLSTVASQSGHYGETVDMIATGTDIKPLEVFLFLRDVRSRVYFEQMKGRGTRVLSPTDLQSVSGEDAHTPRPVSSSWMPWACAKATKPNPARSICGCRVCYLDRSILRTTEP